MSDIIERFLADIARDRAVVEKTVSAYRADLQDARRFAPRGRMDKLKPGHLDAYFLSLSQRGAAISTMRRRRASMSVFLKWLVATGRVRKAPAIAFRPSMAGRRRLPRVLTRHEFASLVRASHLISHTHPHASLLRDHVIIELLASTGLRSIEITRLQFADLDDELTRIRVHGKGDRERIIPLSSEDVRRALRAHVKERKARAPTSQDLFVNPSGGRLSTQSIRIAVARAARVAGVTRRITPHMLRHTFATLLVENGADLRAVQEILGHASLRTTEMYVWVSQTRKAAVLEQFNPRNQLALEEGRA
ncbi:MAG: tyrosine-type recombinase/integrase [Candidatus Thermoplasmatota archaeon]